MVLFLYRNPSGIKFDSIIIVFHYPNNILLYVYIIMRLECREFIVECDFDNNIY